MMTKVQLFAYITGFVISMVYLAKRNVSVYHAVVIAMASCLVYSNISTAPFLHDDVRAIVENPDVQEMKGFYQIWFNDFWGTPMLSKRAHKSYRPLTILMFRFMHKIWGNWPTPYHISTIILHSIVSVLYYFVCQKIVFHPSYEKASLVAGILFALHPIHTEVVCGVVGNAECLAAICSFIALLMYCGETSHHVVENEESRGKNVSPSIRNEKEPPKHQNTSENFNLKHRKTTKSQKAQLLDNTSSSSKAIPPDTTKTVGYLRVLCSLLFAGIAMLCKESGVTVLGVLSFYECTRRQPKIKRSVVDIFDAQFLTRFLFILLWGLGLLWFRLWIMGWSQPEFSVVENAASFAEERLTRVLTYFYLSWFNFWLLLWPIYLCYDYSFGTIPLITSIWDSRNLASLLFLSLCIGSMMTIKFCLENRTNWSKTLLMGWSLLAFPFLPASNLFFPVGFVVAERILYLPSSGFIILFVLLWCKGLDYFSRKRKILHFAMILLFCVYSFYTFNRNFAWTSNELLFKSGVDTYPNNAKIRYNWGTHLQNISKYEEAIVEYKATIKIYPKYYQAYNNWANIWKAQNKYLDKVENLYSRALEANPMMPLGYYNLAAFLLNQNKTAKGFQVLEASTKHADGNLQRLLKLADQVHKHFNDKKTEQIYFNLIKRSCQLEDFQLFCGAAYLPALEDYAKSIAEKKHLHQKALQIYDLIAKIKSGDSDVIKRIVTAFSETSNFDEILTTMLGKEIDITHENKEKSDQKLHDLWKKATAMFRKKRFDESKILYETYIKANPLNMEAKGQYAALLFQTGNQKQGEEILWTITQQDKHCHHSGVWHNLATIYGRQNQYKKAIDLLRNCWSHLQYFTQPEYNKQRSAILCQLGKHEWHQSFILKKNGKVSESNSLKEDAKKNLRMSLDIYPANQEALNAISQMNE